MSIKQVDKMNGYKATNGELKCRDFQFKLGEWFEHSGELELCKQGFHFCRYPSGVWSYYSDASTRVFEVEAECVLQEEGVSGAEEKLVCRRIRLVKEITPGQMESTKAEKPSSDSNTGSWNTGYRNTGDRNTGYRNTGDRNTGDSNTGDSNTGDSNTGNRNTGSWNTGDSNTGYWNTGDSNTGSWNTGYSNTGDSNTGYSNTGDSNTGYRNTGYSNTGYRNTGNWNTGDSNTGNWNTGDSNTGNSNTGYRNTGYSNTGDSNTGYWNTGDWNTGYFNDGEPDVVVFNTQTQMKSAEFLNRHPECYDLGRALYEDAEIDFEKYKNIPGITPGKLKALHAKHLEGRKKK